MLLILLFILAPIIGLPVYLFVYFYDKNKKGILYSIIIGITLGLIAYYFIPPTHYDLYRHKLIVNNFVGKDFNSFLTFIKYIDLEFLPQLYCYLISLTKNFDLLQFFVVGTGYSVLFYMLYDYRKISELNNLFFIPIVLFTIFGFHPIYFISGLYFYLAVIIFAFAIYNEYTKKGNKILSYVLYIFAMLLHNSMFFAGAILIIYKLFRNKFNIKSVLICIFIFLFAYNVLELLYLNFNVNLFKNLFSMYNSYVNNDYRMQKYYTGIVLIIEIIKIFVTVLCIFLQKEKDKYKGINGYILTLLLCTLILLTRSRIVIRFAMLIQFLGIVPMMDYFKKKNKNTIIVLILIAVCALLFIAHFYKLINNENFGDLRNMFYKNIFAVLGKK